MVVAAVSKDASAITVTAPVRRGLWRGRNDGKDASNRGNATGNNQPAQQKDERADKRSGSEDATRGDRRSRDCSLWRATYLLEAAVRSGILETTYRVVLRGSGSGGGCRGDATTDDIIHNGASTGKPCFDAGRLTTQHLSDGSYYAIANLMLREGRRHAVRVRRGRGRRAQIGRNNQIWDDSEDVERYCCTRQSN